MSEATPLDSGSFIDMELGADHVDAVLDRPDELPVRPANPDMLVADLELADIPGHGATGDQEAPVLIDQPAANMAGSVAPPAVMPPIMPGKKRTKGQQRASNPIAGAVEDSSLTPMERKLFAANWESVEYIARGVLKRYSVDPQELEEAILDGNFGLVKAIKGTLDPSKANTKATSHTAYVQKTIRGEILNGLRQRHGRTTEKIEDEKGKVVGKSEVIARLKPSVMSTTADSFDRPLAAGDERTLSDVTPGPTGESEIIGRIDFKTRLERILTDCHPRDREIFLRRLIGGQDQREIGEAFDMTPQNVGRITRLAWYYEDELAGRS